MRFLIFLIFLAAIPRVQAQVSVDLRALDQAGPANPAPAAPRPAPRPRVTEPVAPKVAAPAPVPAPTPAVPAAAPGLASPPNVSIPVVPAMPVARPAAPPPATTAAPPPPPPPPPDPIRLVFRPAVSELTPRDEAAVRALAKAIPAPATSAVTITAYASGTPDDPSTPRRLSLARGMAVRAVLMDAGIPSAQIYVRAQGARVIDDPADRVELSVARIGEVTR